MSVTVRPGTPEEARPLLEASHALMRSLFPAESNHFLGFDELAKPDIHFFVAEEAGYILGCGALAVKDGYGEVKSMFTAEAGRGRGIGASILDAIEHAARAEGLPVLRLETGNSLHSAHRLYHRHDFVERGPFGEYAEDPLSLFMEKRL